MNFKTMVFPSPKSSYSFDHPDLYWLAKPRLKNKLHTFVNMPFIFIRNNSHYDRILIYFHGNCEDANLASSLAEYFADRLHVNLAGKCTNR